MNLLAFISNLRGPDLIIILIIILVLFGSKKLPSLARGMAEAIKEFNKAKDDLSSEPHQPTPNPPVTAPEAPRLAAAPISPAAAPSAQDIPTRAERGV
jgi:sec-independent protein translocase protein TatA